MEYLVDEKVDGKMRMKSAEAVFNAIVEHTKDLIDKNMYLDYSSLMESEYGYIVDACVKDVMRKLHIPTDCEDTFNLISEYVEDTVNGFNCDFEDMCHAIISGR